ERVTRQAEADEKRVASLTAEVKAYRKINDRDTAGRVALELKRAQQELAENQDELKLHESAYHNHLTKMQHATKKLNEVQTRIRKYDAELKMSAAEAEMAKLAESFNFNVTADFGELENMIQNKIDVNRAKVRVS